jgi:LruC domain-containing protein
MKLRKGLIFASGVTLLSMTGCVDQAKDLFDPIVAAAEYDSAFPVSGIDPSMDWTTTSSATVNVAVEEDAGVNYTVRIFTANPLSDSSSAKVLAKGTASKGNPFVDEIDVPVVLGGVYIARTDEHNRHLLKYATVKDGKITATFGVSSTATRSGNLVAAPATRADNYDFPTLKPALSASEAQALMSGYNEYSSGTTPSTGEVWTNDGCQSSPSWKISAGKSAKYSNGYFNTSLSSNFIVAGTLELDYNNVQITNINIYVLKGGVVKFNNLKLNGVATITVYEGGTLIDEDGTLDIASCGVYNNTTYETSSYLADYSTHNVFYNAGTVKVKTLIGSHTDIYNDVTGDISNCSLELNGTNDSFVNHGKLTLTSTTGKEHQVFNDGTISCSGEFLSNVINKNEFYAKSSGTNYNHDVVNFKNYVVDGVFHGDMINYGSVTVGSVYVDDNNTLENYCHFLCNGDFRGDITTGENSLTEIKGDLKAGYYRTLADKSAVVVSGKAYLHSALFKGPATGSALFRVGTVADFCINSSTYDGYNPQNIILEYADYAIEGNNEHINSSKSNFAYFAETGGSVALTGESTFMLGASDCTGEGIEPKSEGSKTIDTIESQAYSFVFEDNYPEAGDYDFNDAVIDLTVNTNKDASNNVLSSDIEVKLRAVGGIKNIGAALRLAGISNSDVTSVTFSDPDNLRGTLSDKESVLGTDNLESGNSYPVIPLFGNAHAALGLSDHQIVNTGVGTTVAVKSLTVHIESSKKIGADNLDLFIVNGNTDGKKRVEVHTYKFLTKYGATANGSICAQNLAAAGNKTWALSIPDFKYPKEYVSIKIAYPDFEPWAQSRDGHAADSSVAITNENWYNNPASGNSYIYGK